MVLYEPINTKGTVSVVSRGSSHRQTAIVICEDLKKRISNESGIWPNYVPSYSVNHDFSGATDIGRHGR